VSDFGESRHEYRYSHDKLNPHQDHKFYNMKTDIKPYPTDFLTRKIITEIEFFITLTQTYLNPDPICTWERLQISNSNTQYTVTCVKSIYTSSSFATLRCISNLGLDSLLLMSTFNVPDTLYRFDAVSMDPHSNPTVKQLSYCNKKDMKP